MTEKDAYWFRHDSNASSDLKLRALRKQHGWQGIGWYWFIIEILRCEADFRLPYSDFTFDSLSEEMKASSEEVKGFLDDCINKFFLFRLNGEFFCSDRLLRDMANFETLKEKKREAGKISAERRFGKSFREDEKVNNKQLDPRLVGMVKIYEDEIGILTPNLLEELKDILNTYPEGWFEKAVKEAVTQNARKLSYIKKVLENWHKDGINGGTHRRDNRQSTPKSLKDSIEKPLHD